MTNNGMRKVLALCLIIILGLNNLKTIAYEASAETAPDTVANEEASQDNSLRILMVGNSLTRYNSVADKLETLFAYAGKQATVDTRTQMGASLIDQAEILATSTREAIVYGDYDYIVLQEKSSGFTEALLRQGVDAFAPWIQEAESQPQLVLYMPWANEDVLKTMQTTFTNAYVSVAKDYDALLAPSGEAYYDLYFNEGKKWYRNGDNVHGNDLASLISASTLFYTIAGQEQDVLQIREEDQSVVKALVESSDYRNYPVSYDRDLVNLIERKAYSFTNDYRDPNHVPDLTGRGMDETINLAKQKQGSASSNARGATRGIGARTVANLTDGSYTSFITLHEDDPDPWFAVDLGVQATFNQLILYWGGTGDYADSYKTKFTIEGTNDLNSEYEVIATGQSINTNKQVITFPSVEYQYVRVHVAEKTSTYASLYEMEIYNAPHPDDGEEPNTDFEVKVGDYLQVQVGDAVTNMSLYENNMYEAEVAFPQGVKDYKLLNNGETIYKGSIATSTVAQNIIIRLFASDAKVVTGQDVHNDVNGNPVQDIKKVANWTGNFFNRTGIEEFKEFGGWDQASPLSTLNYVGGGIFARELTYTVPAASVTYEYKVNFDRTWNNGEIPSSNRRVVFPTSDKERDTFVIWVNSVRGEIFDSISDGNTVFRIKANDEYSKPIGTAKVELSLIKDDNENLYSMVQTSKDAYMVTAFIEPGTYTWSDRIDTYEGTLTGNFTVNKDTAVTFYYHVNNEDYGILNTVNHPEEFFGDIEDDTDLASVEAALAALEVGFAEGDAVDHVTQQVVLPAEGLDGVAISWSSDQPNIISSNGAVQRPLTEDATVNLVATLTKGQASDTKSFILIVKAVEEEDVLVESITINGQSSITRKGGTLQLTAEVSPENATNKAVAWSIENGSGKATINATGLITAVSNGTVTVIAMAADGSGIEGKKVITISGQTVSNPEPSTPTPTEPVPTSPAPTSPASTSTPVQTDVIKDGDKAIVELGSDVTSKSIAVQELTGLSLQVKAGQTLLTVPAEVLKQWLMAAGNPAEVSLEVTIAPVSSGNLDHAPAEDGQARVKVAGEIYDITLQLRHSNGMIDLATAASGVEITLPYSNGADAELLGIYYYNEESKQWEYVGGRVDATDHTVTVTLQHLSTYAVLEYSKSFTDVPANHWAHRTLEVLAAKHIVNGTSETHFTPNGTTTRAEFTSLLVRALGLTNTASAVPFTDVQAGQWYAKEVAAAYEAGLVSGVTADKFEPNAKITREQMAALLVRAMEYKNRKISYTGQETSSLKDQASISSWAQESVNKALAAGLLQGKGNGIFDPTAEANRAETAQAILNLLNKE